MSDMTYSEAVEHLRVFDVSLLQSMSLPELVHIINTMSNVEAQLVEIRRRANRGMVRVFREMRRELRTART